MKKDLQQKNTTCVIYTRVSSKDQLDGYSLETQEKLCKEYAVKNGLTILRIFCEEGESAKTANRTQLQEMLKFVALHKTHIGHLVIHKLDRLSRSSGDYFFLKTLLANYGVKINYASEPVDESSMGELMGVFLSGIAQFDNRVRTERTVLGMKAALSAGYWAFKAPFGYKNVIEDKKKKRFEHSVTLVDEEQAEVVRMVFAEYIKKIYTFRELAIKVNKFSNGKYRISPQYLVKVLKNQLYYGWLEVPSWDISNEGRHQPIISKSLFDQAQVILRGGNPHKQPRNRHHPDFPLRGILCNNCGHSFTGGHSRGKLGKLYDYYHCGKKECEMRKSIQKKVFELEFTEFLQSLTPKPDHLEILAEAVKLAYKQEVGLMVVNKSKIEKEIIKRRDEKEKLLQLKLMDNSPLSIDDYKRHNEKLENEIQTLETSLVEVRNSGFNIADAIDFVFGLIKNLPTEWQALDVVDFKALRNILFPKNITYYYPGFQTPELSFIYSMNQQYQGQKETLVDQESLGWNTIESTVLSWKRVFSLYQIQVGA